MVDIKAALKKARSAGRTATPRGRAIVEVTGFDVKENTATGKILDGLGAGETITFKLSGKLTAEDYTKKSRTKVITAEGDTPGGTLQVEGLAKKDGSDVYETRWVKTFQPKPEDGQNLHVKSTCTLSVYKTKGGKTAANLNVLDMPNEAHVTDISELRSAIVAGLNKTGAITMMTVTEEGDAIINPCYTKRVKQEDGTYLRQSGEDWLAEFESSLQDGSGVTLEEVFGSVMDKSGVSIVPTTSLRIGTGTWDAVEEKLSEGQRGGPVDPESFKPASVSGRLAGAYARLDIEADRDAVVKSFLSSANEDAKSRFHEGGFAAVEPRDVQAFLDKSGLSLTKVPEGNGFISGGILTLPYDKDKPENGEMVTKTFNVTAAAPFPPVKAFESIREAYYAEMLDAVRAIADMELSGAKADAKSEAPAKEDKPSASAAAIADASPVMDDDIDDLLGDIANEGIDP